MWAYVFVPPPRARTYLEGSHAKLNTEAQINVVVVGQKIEEHVVGAKQRDEEEGGLSQTSVGQKRKRRTFLPTVMHQDVLISERNLGYSALSLRSVVVLSGKAAAAALQV